MKSIVKKIVGKNPFIRQNVAAIALCVVLFIATGCGTFEDSTKDSFWEIHPNSRNTVINRRIDGIEFMFCLLNEKGEPATKFKQDENFSFYFAMTNYSRKKNYIIDFEDGLRENGFSRVISQTQDTIGFSFSRGLCNGRLEYLPFYGKNNRYDVTVPWSDQREHWSSMQCTFSSLNQPFLPKGKYYTDFSHKFLFIVGSLEECSQNQNIVSLNLKINFLIE